MPIDPPSLASASAPDASISRDAALAYWSSISADNEGMLGGYPQVSRIDIQGSSNFLAKLQRLDHASSTSSSASTSTATSKRKLEDSDSAPDPGKTGIPGVGGRGKRVYERAADCGAGIGRITMGLLVHHAKVVDVVEPVKKFTDALVAAAPAAMRKDAAGEVVGTVGRIYNLGLEDWDPCDLAGAGVRDGRQDVDVGTASGALGEGDAGAEEGTGAETGRQTEGGTTPAPTSTPTYDLIWNQWCLGQLTDAQLVLYLRCCALSLLPSGWIIVKENMSSHIDGTDIFDDTDSSVTRSDQSFRRIFEKAGLSVVLTEVQRGMPRELFAVRAYALRPRSWT